MPVLPVAGAAVGGAFGLFLDRGLAVLLPCSPWPEPWLAGWGWLVGAVTGVLGGWALAAAATRGSLAPPPKGAVLRAALGAGLFVLASTAMVGGIGYAAGQRAGIERETSLLRELRRDIDKKLVDADDAAPRLRELEAMVANANNPRQAFSTTRRAAGVGGFVSAIFGIGFGAMAVVYRRALATRDQAA